MNAKSRNFIAQNLELDAPNQDYTHEDNEEVTYFDNVHEELKKESLKN